MWSAEVTCMCVCVCEECHVDVEVCLCGGDLHAWRECHGDVEVCLCGGSVMRTWVCACVGCVEAGVEVTCRCGGDVEMTCR